MKLKIIVSVLTFSALSLVGTAAQARSAMETGMAIAKKRGYSNPACYAGVFAAYASQDAHGKFKAPRGKAATGYKNEQQAKCGISI